jgi:hypothetical protein
VKAQYPRLLATALGVFPTGTYRAVLYRVDFGSGDWAAYVELARCAHLHRNRRKAAECAEQLARLDGAPEL